MNYSFDSHRKYENNRQPKLFPRETLETMTNQQRQFAELQFQKIYASEMSKLMSEISHKKKVKQNLETIDNQEKQAQHQQNEKLKFKMMQTDRKRQQNINQKLKLYKLNDEKWQKKMEDIERKFKNKNQEALEKANQCRQKAEEYWQKKKKSPDTSRANLIDQSSSRVSGSHRQQKNFNLQHDSSKFPLPAIRQGRNSKYLFKEDSRTICLPQHGKSPYQSNSLHLNGLQLDDQIKKHQQRVTLLQHEKEEQILQKAMEKMDRIEATRRDRGKKQEGKVSQPTIPRKPRNIQLNLNGSYDKNRSRQTLDPNQLKQQSSIPDIYHLSRSKESLDQLIVLHKALKDQKEQQQFNHRGELLDKQVKRNKKTKILRMIRDKVQYMKMEAIKNAQIG